MSINHEEEYLDRCRSRKSTPCFYLFSSNKIHKQIPLAPGRKVALAL